MRKIYSPVDGVVKRIEECSDDVFSSKILGEGVLIIPDNGMIYAPIKGRVTFVADAYHAINIKSEDDFDLFLHLGIDTVHLKGEGLECFVVKNREVEVGDLIAKMDLEFLSQHKITTEIPVVIMNGNNVKKIKVKTKLVKHTKNVIIRYKK